MEGGARQHKYSPAAVGPEAGKAIGLSVSLAAAAAGWEAGKAAVIYNLNSIVKLAYNSFRRIENVNKKDYFPFFGDQYFILWNFLCK